MQARHQFEPGTGESKRSIMQVRHLCVCDSSACGSGLLVGIDGFFAGLGVEFYEAQGDGEEERAER